ncbi:MAG TPA: lysophospholipid acyltransferase family protein [Phototrophicaceae bacterium]|nr:lysophospholipid acyltransferase family protein [Phototrophicaceae bacterium]
MTAQASIQYPRKQLLRASFRFMGRALTALLTRLTITGKENLPQKGPLIVVGNHVAMLEAALMVLYTPWDVELMAAGEIPLDPRYAPIVNTYGYIPIHRGAMDRQAMEAALEVLKQGGVIGMFPEGGIWESAFKRPRTGVSWLSYHAAAPILPIGFGGIDGALAAAMSLKRPRLSMNIGEIMPPVQDEGNKPLKVTLEEGARNVMARIESLVPEEDKRRWNRIRDERFELQLTAFSSGGTPVVIPPELLPPQPELLSKFFHRPLLLDVMSRNLKLPVEPLQRLKVEHDPTRLAGACQLALDYLHQNPHFLTYRFGYDQGNGMKAGLEKLREICQWAETYSYQVSVTPIRRYKRRGNDEEIVEDGPGSLPAL